MFCFRTVQRLGGRGTERGQGHRPGRHGGVQRDQVGRSLVQTNQVLGSERSGAIWVSDFNLSGLDTVTDLP